MIKYEVYCQHELQGTAGTWHEAVLIAANGKGDLDEIFIKEFKDEKVYLYGLRTFVIKELNNRYGAGAQNV